MKKYFYFIAMLFVVAISIFNVINLHVRSNVSQMRLANIEALSEREDPLLALGNLQIGDVLDMLLIFPIVCYYKSHVP